MEIGIRKFKNDLSGVLARVAAGEVVTVTRRGRPVARVVPAALPSGLAALVAQGRAEWTGGRLDLPKPVRLTGDGPTMGDYVIEGRR